jgi:glutaconyl-CoA decarboxylase
MSRYELVINGSPYTVEVVEVSGNHATVDVNGMTYRVEIGGGPVAGPGPSAVAPQPAPSAPIPRPAPPAPKPAPAAPRPDPAPISAPAHKPAEAPVAPAGGGVITAPMPGHILNVTVKEGDAVQAEDTVALMEAMKMENEIKTHVAGKVLEVRVADGQDVGVGEVLVVIGSP